MNWPFLALALICAGFVQGLSGFGFGLVSMSLMPLFLSVKQAAAISTVYSLLATVTIFTQHYREYNWRLGLTFLNQRLCRRARGGIFSGSNGGKRVVANFGNGHGLLFAARAFLLQQQPQTFPKILTVSFGLFSGTLSGAFNLRRHSHGCLRLCAPMDPSRPDYGVLASDDYGELHPANHLLQQGRFVEGLLVASCHRPCGTGLRRDLAGTHCVAPRFGGSTLTA